MIALFVLVTAIFGLLLYGLARIIHHHLRKFKAFDKPCWKITFQAGPFVIAAIPLFVLVWLMSGFFPTGPKGAFTEIHGFYEPDVVSIIRASSRTGLDFRAVYVSYQLRSGFSAEDIAGKATFSHRLSANLHLPDSPSWWRGNDCSASKVFGDNLGGMVMCDDDDVVYAFSIRLD